MWTQYKTKRRTQRPNSADSAAVAHDSRLDGFEIPFRHPEAEAQIQREGYCFVAEPDRGFCVNPNDQADGFYE